MAAVFPFLVLAGPPGARDRVTSCLAGLPPGRLREGLFVGRLVAIDERPVIRAWRDDDDLLARRGKARLHTDAVWAEVLAERLELEAWRAHGQEVTVVVGFDTAEAIGRLSERLLEAAAVLVLGSGVEADAALDEPRLARVPVDGSTPADEVARSLEAALSRLRGGGRVRGPAPGAAERAPAAATDDFAITERDASHFEAHAREMLISRDEVERAIRRALSRCPREGEVRIAVRCDRAVGRTGLERVRLRDAASFWAPRAGRSLPSHLVAGRRRLTHWLAFWGAWRDPGTFVLHTFYPGRPAPREIHDPQVSPQELKEAVAFWATHAIVVEREGG